MRQMLHLKAEASLPEILAAITRARVARVGLAFPLGAHPTLTDAALLQALRYNCEQMGKDVVIFGGDTMLRANAVTCGFVVATSPDDWHEESPRSLPHVPHVPHVASLWHARQPEREKIPLRLVEPEGTGDEDEDVWAPSWEEQPPAYVRHLLAGSDEDPREQTQALSQWQLRIFYRRPPVDDAEILCEAHETYEESITAKIRITGKPKVTRPLSPRLPDNPNNSGCGSAI